MSVYIPPLTKADEADVLWRTQEGEKRRGKEFGDEIFIVSASWFSSWSEYSGYPPKLGSPKSDSNRDGSSGAGGGDAGNSSARPGPVDNSDILDLNGDPGALSAEEFADTGPLKPGLKEGKDFVVLHKPAWLLLKEWYGVSGHEIRREFLPCGATEKPDVDAYQWFVKVEVYGTDLSVVVPCLRMSSGNVLKDTACTRLDIKNKDLYSVCLKNTETGDLETIDDALWKTLIGMKLKNYCQVFLRAKMNPVLTAHPLHDEPRVVSSSIPCSIRMPSENVIDYGSNAPPQTPPSPNFGSIGSPRRGILSSPLSSSPLSRSFGRVPMWAEDSIATGMGVDKGLAGLSNLGNTCFMNSSLQCLSHTPALMYAFLSGQYKDDLNSDNPLGLGGKLACAFGGLMAKLWKGDVTYVTPKHFKWQLAKFAPQFGGYSQQDSQELLAFLLDGLHEDLNRIKDKPYKEEKDADGRPDEEVAAEAWENYRARNDSVIVDTFQGLYKSTLRCPNCDYLSVKFDPFMYLSLPLPSPKRRTFTVTIIDQFGNHNPLEVGVRISKQSKIADLVRDVSKIFEDHYQTGHDDDEWVLLQWNGSKAEIFTNTDAWVDTIPEARKLSLFSSTRNLRLFAFRFHGNFVKPSVASRPVLVFHKDQNQHSVSLPSLLFLANGEPCPTLEVSPAEQKGYWEVEPDLSLESALNQIVRSIATQTSVSNGMQDMDTSENLEADNEDGEKEAISMASEENDPAQTQQGSQEGRGGQAISKKKGRSFKLLICNYSGQPKYTWTSTPPQFGGEDDSSPIHVAAEWCEGIQLVPTAYDQPTQHESVKDTDEQSKIPYKATLRDCLEAFCQPEQLDASDTWYCSKCKDHVRAEKKLDLWHLPDVLVVHLKRFSYSRYSRDKLDTDIEFPLHSLDLSEFIQAPSASKKQKISDDESSEMSISKPSIYDLYAVSNHFGGLGGGHYTAFCKMPDGQWYDFDDSHVNGIQERSIQSSSAYVLFYSRRDSDSGLADKALELSERITHEEEPKACDSPVHPIGVKSPLSRPSLEIVQENPLDDVADEATSLEANVSPMASVQEAAKCTEAEEDADIMNIDAI